MIDGYKPQLYPNDSVKIEDVKGEYLCSPKMDGVRCIIADGHIMSRSASDAGDPIPLKRIQSKSIVSRLQSIADLAKENNILLDGELYAHGMDFNTLSGHVRRIDGEAPKEIQFHAFDCIVNGRSEMDAWARTEWLLSFTNIVLKNEVPNFHMVLQVPVSYPMQVVVYFALFMQQGYEGAILKRKNSPYKFGRITTKSGMGYKLKVYQTFDAQIIGVEQATEVDEFADKTIDSFGRSHTSKKQDDRVLINKASAFLVKYKGFESKVTIAATDAEKEEIWANRQRYIGRWIEYEGMLVGSKDVPRHPVFLRYRQDRD